MKKSGVNAGRGKVRFDSGLGRLGPAIIRVQLVINKEGNETVLVHVKSDKGTRSMHAEVKETASLLLAVVAP